MEPKSPKKMSMYGLSEIFGEIVYDRSCLITITVTQTGSLITIDSD